MLWGCFLMPVNASILAWGWPMSELHVSAWKRHGLDRLYVNRPDGTTVARLDLKTGHIEIRNEALRQPVLDALAPQMTRRSTPPHISGRECTPPLPPAYAFPRARGDGPFRQQMEDAELKCSPRCGVAPFAFGRRGLLRTAVVGSLRD